MGSGFPSSFVEAFVLWDCYTASLSARLYGAVDLIAPCAFAFIYGYALDSSLFSVAYVHLPSRIASSHLPSWLDHYYYYFTYEEHFRAVHPNGHAAHTPG